MNEKRKRLSVVVLLATAFCTICSATPFKDGDRVVFFGDSITHGGRYGEYVNLFYATRYPERNIWFSNSGWSGARAEQGLWSIEDDIVAKKPTVVTVMFGMNDINRDVWPRTNDTPALAARREGADVAFHVEHGAEYARASPPVAQVPRRRQARRLARLRLPPRRLRRRGCLDERASGRAGTQERDGAFAPAPG